MNALFSFSTLAQADDGGIASLIFMCCPLVFFLIIAGAVIAGSWKIFEKAGQPGWAAVVPIYNMWILTTEVAKKEPLWFILFLVPCANLVAAVIVSIAVAEQFGKGTGYGIGLAFLPIVFYPLLGFGDATYQGSTAGAAGGGGEFAV